MTALPMPRTAEAPPEMRCPITAARCPPRIWATIDDQIGDAMLVVGVEPGDEGTACTHHPGLQRGAIATVEAVADQRRPRNTSPTISAVPSDEPSSTTMISAPGRAAESCCSVGPIPPASLNAGITTETSSNGSKFDPACFGDGLDVGGGTPCRQGQKCPEGVTRRRISVNVRPPKPPHLVRPQERRQAIGLAVEQAVSERPQACRADSPKSER